MTDPEKSGRKRAGDEGDRRHSEHDSPEHSAEQASPSEVRPPTPEEEEGEALEDLEHPPEAEGSRETVEEDQERGS